MNVYEKLEHLESKGWIVKEDIYGFKWVIYFPEEFKEYIGFPWDGCKNLDHLINYSFDEYEKWEKKNGSET